MKASSQIQQWNKICNMRTTLLQLQYLHCHITQNIEQQEQKFDQIHKDRIIQYQELCQQNSQLTSNNFKILLIAKLQSLLSVCATIDDAVWTKLEQFLASVRFIEDEMSRDVCKLYIGNKIMLDISRCEKQLKIIQAKIEQYVQHNQQNINQYNKNIKQLESLQQMWEKYLAQLLQQIRQKIQPHYAKYLRKKLQVKEKQLQANIKILKDFIKS